MEAILQSSGFTVVGHWTDGGEALAAAELPGVDLLILARRLIEVSGLANSFRPLDGDYVGKIIVVLEPEDDFSTKDFVTLEVEGLLLSSAGVEEVRDCVASVEHGRRWVDPGIRLLLGHAEPPHPDYRGLSERELEVVRLAASGMSNKRIARALHVSDGTVKMHMHHVLASSAEAILSGRLTTSPRQAQPRVRHCIWWIRIEGRPRSSLSPAPRARRDYIDQAGAPRPDLLLVRPGAEPSWYGRRA
jgi:two-component system nitrate/nitrite response regulator NarP